MPKKLKLILYRISTNQLDGIENWPEYFLGFRVVIYRPGLFSKPKHGTSFLRNFGMSITTRGRFKILVLYDNDTLVHWKGISPYSFRYRYMKRNDIHHQHAFTNSDYRGRGLFTGTLKLVAQMYKKEDRYVWVYCDIDNIPSQKAITRAGYEFVSFAEVNTLTKIVKLTSSTLTD